MNKKFFMYSKEMGERLQQDKKNTTNPKLPAIHSFERTGTEFEQVEPKQK